MRHCIRSRSSGPIPTCEAVASHSWSVRQAIVTENAAMLPAMALPGSPSRPAVMTSLRSIASNAARTQSEVSWLSGSGPGTNPARKILARVSSSRHRMNSACSSRDAEPGPARDRASFPGSSPIHDSSASDSSESNAEESQCLEGSEYPWGRRDVCRLRGWGVGRRRPWRGSGPLLRGLGGNGDVSGCRCCRRRWWWRLGPGSPGLVLGRSRLSGSPVLSG